jgi:hypothetical protein
VAIAKASNQNRHLQDRCPKTKATVKIIMRRKSTKKRQEHKAWYGDNNKKLETNSITAWQDNAKARIHPECKRYEPQHEHQTMTRRYLKNTEPREKQNGQNPCKWEEPGKEW